jgi:galactoside O-acetyltransferase
LGAGAVIGQGVLTIGPKSIFIGDHFSCWRNCALAACDDGLIQIGNRVGLNANVYLNACGGGRIVLEDDVLIAPNVVMRTNEHNTGALDRPINLQGSSIGEIIVERDAWIASNVTISGRVRIGHGAVVAAGAVVVRDVEPFTMVGGVPARFIKKRGKDDGEK